MLSKFEIESLTSLPESVEEFLNLLQQPRYIVLDGVDNSRTRIFVTLQHGNEPSGVMALLRWLKEKKQPAVRIVCIIASVKTALESPLFNYRTLPGNRDLNRCYNGPFDDCEGQLAKAILALIDLYQPEAIIDMHNTSGTGAAFGVATFDHPSHHALTKPFSDKLVLTHLSLGALMDISSETRPCVTIEVGGRLDQAAHEDAWNGLCDYFSDPYILDSDTTYYSPNTIKEPIRMEIKKGVSLCYADTENNEFDITLFSSIDRLNFKSVDCNTQLGWINRGGLDNFIISDCKYNSMPVDWLRVEDNRLYPAQNSMLFMITTNPVIATNDCLFYGVKSQ